MRRFSIFAAHPTIAMTPPTRLNGPFLLSIVALCALCACQTPSSSADPQTAAGDTLQRQSTDGSGRTVAGEVRGTPSEKERMAGDGARGATEKQVKGGEQRVYSPEDQRLMERMRDADVGQIKAYMREVLALPLPPDHVLPAEIANAGSPQKAQEVLDALYPEFVGKEGPSFFQAIAAEPVRYREMILETRALRLHYTGNAGPSGVR